MVRVVAAVVMLVAVASASAPASADVKVVKGGALRGGAAAALGEAERAMSVCWRGTPPATVRVAIGVDAGGVVTASALDGGATAQCAAGVLAVWTVPGGAWKGEVQIASRVGAGDLAGAISRQLAARGDTIRACQAAAPAAAGPVTIRMKVHPEGELTDVVVSSKLGAALDRCVKTAVGGLRLDPLAADAPVAYQLAVTFAGKAARPGGAGAGAGAGVSTVVEAGDGDAAGSVDGALTADSVQAVLRPGRAKLAACLKAKGAGGGQVTVRFTVRADGTTKNVAIKDARGATADEACVKKAIGGLTFTAAGDETRVMLPLTVK